MDTRRKIREISDDLKRFSSHDPVSTLCKHTIHCNVFVKLIGTIWNSIMLSFRRQHVKMLGKYPVLQSHFLHLLNLTYFCVTWHEINVRSISFYALAYALKICV